MTTSTLSGGRGKRQSQFVTGFVDIFQSREFGEKFQISLLNMKEILKWIVEADTARLQQGLVVLRAET